MYYQPGESTSYESIRFLTTKVPFGWLVRSVHCWSAHLMIVSLVVHMLSAMMLKAYRPPRELTWVTGFALFGLALGFGFSGYLLPWNELAFFATAVGTDSVKSVPVVGEWLLNVLRGGPDVTINTLYRFFALHVCILPIAAVGLMGIHLLFVQRQGMALPIGDSQPRSGMRFFPNFAMRDLALWLNCLILLLVPLAPAYPGIKPEWYFLWVYQLLKEFPPHLFGLEGPQVCLLVVNVLMAIWVLVPWLDRGARRDEPSPAFSDFGVAAILFLVFLTLKAWDLGGGGDGGGQLPDPAAAARFCTWILISLFVVVTVVRFAIFRHRWFILSGAALLHAVLHGLGGLSYLAAGVIAAALAAAATGFVVIRASRSSPAGGGR
jgi:cytochrome b6